MRKFIPVIMLFVCHSVYGAELTNKSSAYLQNVADAWATVIGGGTTGGEIARLINNAGAISPARYRELISIIGYNDSALTIFNTDHHIDMAYNVISNPMQARRPVCRPNTPQCRENRPRVYIGANGFAAMDDYDSHANGDFKTRGGGANLYAKTYITDGISLGLGYTYSESDTHDSDIYADAKTNSIMLFSEYLAPVGIFINAGAMIGKTSWSTDKTVAGIINNGEYNTDFISGQILSGIDISRKNVSITPYIGARYMRIASDKHIDAAAQAFKKWWFNTLSGSAAVNIKFKFNLYNTLIQPSAFVGGSYDAISHGTDNIGVEVISGKTYTVPLESPERLKISGGIGIDVRHGSFMAGLHYKMDARDNYMSHSGILNLKIAF